MSVYFVRVLLAPLQALCIASWLSVSSNISEVELEPIANTNILLIKTHSWVAIPEAQYTAPAVDIATAICFFDCHNFALFVAQYTYLDVGFQFVLQPAQSALQYSTNVS